MKRWPIIRHVRYYWLSYKLHRWAYSWFSVGIGLGYPNPSDTDYLNRIWRGEI